MANLISETKKQQILELYLCSNDRRLKVISEITNSSDNSVSAIIQEYFDNNLDFERGNYKILHSKINGYD